MDRYIALLRDINISGKNKVPMADLKTVFEGLGFTAVQTHLNSGNVIFNAEGNAAIPAGTIRAALKERYGFDIPVFVIRQAELEQLLAMAPAWWGTEDKKIYDNLIFMIPPYDAHALAEKIGEPTPGLEQVLICGNAVFWSFDRQRYGKANWWKKTAAAGIGEMITVRTANTLRKIVRM